MWLATKMLMNNGMSSKGALVQHRLQFFKKLENTFL